MKFNEMQAKFTVEVNEDEKKKLLEFLKTEVFEDILFYEEKQLNVKAKKKTKNSKAEV